MDRGEIEDGHGIIDRVNTAYRDGEINSMIAINYRETKSDVLKCAISTKDQHCESEIIIRHQGKEWISQLTHTAAC